jgi:hypothetical protein
MEFSPKNDSTVRLVVKLLRSMTTQGGWESYADLKEDLKRQCAKLKIRYDASVISDALTLIESNKPLLPSLRPPNRTERIDPDRGLSREDAKAIVAMLERRLRRPA